MERHPTQSLPTSSDIWEFLKAILRTGHWRKTLRRGWCSSPVSSKSLDRRPSHWTFRISKKAMTKWWIWAMLGWCITAPICGAIGVLQYFFAQQTSWQAWLTWNVNKLCCQFPWKAWAIHSCGWQMWYWTRQYCVVKSLWKQSNCCICSIIFPFCQVCVGLTSILPWARHHQGCKDSVIAQSSWQISTRQTAYNCRFPKVEMIDVHVYFQDFSSVYSWVFWEAAWEMQSW